MSANLPASLIRGEQLVLQLTVFNYLDVDLSGVLVTLYATPDLQQVVISDGGLTSQRPIVGNLQQTIAFLGAQSASTVNFILTPVSLGLVAFKVSAQSQVAADAAQLSLQVNAEGMPQTVNTPVFINLGSAASSSYSQVVNTRVLSLK